MNYLIEFIINLPKNFVKLRDKTIYGFKQCRYGLQYKFNLNAINKLIKMQ